MVSLWSRGIKPLAHVVILSHSFIMKYVTMGVSTRIDSILTAACPLAAKWLKICFVTCAAVPTWEDSNALMSTSSPSPIRPMT